MNAQPADPPIVIDQGDDGTVAITTPPGLSITGAIGWDLLVGPARGGPSTTTYAGTATTANGVTTVAWTIPAADTAIAGVRWAVARVRYAASRRTFYRADLQISPNFTN